MEKYMKCDFHHHTYKDSNNVDHCKYTEESFFEAIKKSELDVLCFTDHNLFDKDIYNRCIKENPNKTFFPGVELTIILSENLIKEHNLVVSNNDFHSILIFDQDSNLEKLEEICHGIKNIVDLDKINEIFSGFKFYLIPHYNKSKGVDGYIPYKYESNKIFLQQLFFYNTFGLDGTYNKNIVASKEMGTHLIKEIPIFEFSDRAKLGSKFTWIEFNCTFDGIFTAISSSKTKIIPSSNSDYNPQKNSTDYIEVIEFMQGNVSHSIKCSPSFNGIIGSRGSGKSILGEIITNKIKNQKKNELSISNIVIKKRGQPIQLEDDKILYIRQGYFSEAFKGNEVKLESINFLKEKIDECKSRCEDNRKNLIECIDNFEISSSNFEENLSFNNSIFANEFIEAKSCFKEVVIDNGFDTNKKICNRNFDLLENIEKKFSNLDEFDLKIDPRYGYLKNHYEQKNIKLKEELEIISSSLNKIKKINTMNNNAEVQNKLAIKFNELVSEKIKHEDFSISIISDEKKKFKEKCLEIIDIRLKMRNDLKSLRYLAEEVNGQKIVEISDFSLKTNDGDIASITFEIELPEKINVDRIIKKIFNNYRNDDEFIEKLIFNDIEEIKKNCDGRFFKNINNKRDFFDKFISILKNEITELFSLNEEFITLKRNSIDFKKLSSGQRAETLLLILFKKEMEEKNYSFIVLDQPEDDLDNVTIKETLITCINNYRSKVQLFIISHSASVIVNGNATNIIVCKDISEVNIPVFDYKHGDISEYNTRESIINILDGGEKYVKERFLKYKFEEKNDI